MSKPQHTEEVRETVNKKVSKYYLLSKTYRQKWDSKRKHRSI